MKFLINFFGTALEHFSQFNFKNFHRRPTIVTDIFTRSWYLPFTIFGLIVFVCNAKSFAISFFILLLLLVSGFAQTGHIFLLTFFYITQDTHVLVLPETRTRLFHWAYYFLFAARAAHDMPSRLFTVTFTASTKE